MTTLNPSAAEVAADSLITLSCSAGRSNEEEIINRNRVSNQPLHIKFQIIDFKILVALTGIEGEWRQFRPVQVGLSLCKHVQSVWADHAPQ